MSREILQDIIDNFSPDKFSRFFRDKNRSFSPRQEDAGHYDDENFKNGLRLGEIKFTDTEKLIVCTFQVKQSLSERSGKKAQYEKGKKILRDTQSDAGIFIFYDQTGNFRFSLIYPETIGNRRQWSSFRRFTYFVSREFTNKTFLQRIGDNEFSSIERIKDAFSVEKVTKEFYLEYRKLFESLVKELSLNHTFINEAAKNDINTENFAKKLLGQIVFIYFIQKKGWMGVPVGQNWGAGDKNFLINQFKEAFGKKSNFFNDYLESLFYGTLNNPRRNSADPSFSKEFNCRIPFLNGGLFESEYDWKNSFIYLDNNIFKNIFEVFERFNFTVEEESPDDKEIAVDPEMLGKVFENLLPENLRKGTGTYYTPREIVYYMCQEGLVNYLDANSKLGKDKVEKCVKLLKEDDKFISDKEAVEVDNLLEIIKICDPACGSGAFLVGMLNEIVRLRLLLRVLYPAKLSKKSEYQLKKDTIHNCVYGVDIDPGAIEIAKLRLWLTLVVDYEIRDIEPLPNLDYRLMCGNSLLEEFQGVRFYNGDDEKQDLSLFKDTKKQEKISELKKKVEEYFDIHDDEEKRSKRKEINDIKDWLIKTALEKRRKELASHRKSEEAKLNMFDEENRKKYFSNWGTKFLAEAKINEVLRNLHDPKKAKPFFIWKLEFIDVFEDKGGFDVVIANPPYVDSETMSNDDQNQRPIYSLIYESAQGNWDLFVIFIEKGMRLLCDKGIISYIVPNKLISARYAVTLRNILLHKKVIELRDFSKVDVFKDVNVYPVVFIAQNITARDPVTMSYMGGLTKVDRKNVIPVDVFYNSTDWARYFSGKGELDILLKLSKFPQLNKYCVEISSAATVSEAYEIKKYIRELNAKIKQNYKILVNTGTVDRYLILWGRQKTRYIKASFLKPVILEHDLSSVSPRRLKQSKSQKIIIGGMTKELECAYDDGEALAGKSTTIILDAPQNKFPLKVILALLNSSAVSFWYKRYFSSLSLAGGYLRISNNEIGQIPIPEMPKSSIEDLLSLTGKILALTTAESYFDSSAKQVKVKEYEREIDQMIYKLYGLTKEEIEVIEHSSS